jgi:SPW repeat
VVGVDGVVVLLGVWLVASPFVLDYQTGDASWNPIACGAAAAVVALGQTFGPVRTSRPGLILMAIGTWLFASGFWLEASSQASWNAWGAGALMLFLGCVGVAATQAGRSA